MAVRSIAMLVLASFVGFAFAPPAGAAETPPGQIRVGDLPGTDGNWQFAEVTVNAPAEVVQRWLADASRWQGRFPDVEWAQVTGTTRDGRNIVRFRSRIVGRPLTLRMRERPGLILYDGEGRDVVTHGKVYVEALGDRRTHVILQSSSEVHGAAGWFASKKMKRERTRRKFVSDLSSIIRMSNQWVAAQRRGG
jgi:hypothetical protein